ncbi:MAG TPA: phage portal protein [Anaerolineae bacterium]|nr:phage portal protein [Anaerolineae bacterium]
MGLRDRLQLAAWALFNSKGISGLDMLMGADAKSWFPKTDFNRLSAEGYEYNAVVYACVNERATSTSEPRVVVETKDRKGEWQEKPDHSMARLLDRPNVEMSQYDFFFTTVMYLDIAGNAFWEKERSKAGRVVGLWPMRPDRVGIVALESKPGERIKRRIESYTWRYMADLITLPARNVIQFKHQHPRDDLFGWPPLGSAARQGDTDNRATNYVASFFDNAAVPKGLLSVKGRIDDAEEKRLKKRIHAQFTGQGGWHDTLILGEGSTWTELAETFKDMDFPNLRKMTESRICMVFQVPPILIGAFVGLEHATYSNYGEARESFWKETLMPFYRKLQDTLNRGLAPEFGPDVRMRFDFSTVMALQEDKNQIWTRAREAATAGFITVNDFREQVGLPRVQDGDVFLRPMMISEIPALEEGQQKALQISSPETKMASKLDEEKLEVYYKAFDMVARAWEAQFRRKAQQLFAEELAQILAILRKEGKASIEGLAFAGFLDAVIAFLIGRNGQQGAWAQGFFPLFEGLMESQAENVAGALGIAWDIASPEAQEFIRGYTIKFADTVVPTTERAVRELVGQAQEEGWSVPRLREEITERFTEFDEQRANAIARSETIRSSNAGTHEAWRSAGIERTQWYASIDGRQCPFCEDLYIKYGPGTPGISITENYVNLGDTLTVDAGDGKSKSMTVTYTDVAYPPLHAL